jgi:hypothetical protein
VLELDGHARGARAEPVERSFPLALVKCRETSRACFTTKFVALVPVPPAVVTATGPVEAPAGPLVLIWVAELTTNAAVTPLNLTDVALVKFVPVRTIASPTLPEVGEKEVTVGARRITVNVPALVAVPIAVVTWIGPVIAPWGTVAVICVGEFSTKAAASTPPNLTELVPEKLVPVITTWEPGDPLVGANEVIVGPVLTTSRLQPERSTRCPIRSRRTRRGSTCRSARHR